MTKLGSGKRDVFDELRRRSRTGNYHPDDSPKLDSEYEDHLLEKFLEDIGDEFYYAPIAKKYRNKNCYYKEVCLNPESPNSGLRADCIVLYEGFETWIIEVKERLKPHMLGKLITDEIFYNNIPVRYSEEIKKIAIVSESDDRIEEIFKNHGIIVKKIGPL